MFSRSHSTANDVDQERGGVLEIATSVFFQRTKHASSQTLEHPLGGAPHLWPTPSLQGK